MDKETGFPETKHASKRLWVFLLSLGWPWQCSNSPGKKCFIHCVSSKDSCYSRELIIACSILPLGSRKWWSCILKPSTCTSSLKNESGRWYTHSSTYPVSHFCKVITFDLESVLTYCIQPWFYGVIPICVIPGFDLPVTNLIFHKLFLCLLIYRHLEKWHTQSRLE